MDELRLKLADTEVRAADRSLPRPAGALRPEDLARQRSAHGVWREHAARCAVRARRRHPRPRAGRRLRSRARRPQRAGGEATGARRARPSGALSAGSHARFRPLPSLDRRAGGHVVRRTAHAARQAHRDDLPLPSREDTCANATSTRTSSRFPAPSRSRPAWVAPISSATSSRPARRSRPTTCAKSRPCWKATPCSSARRSICRLRRTNGCSGC